MRWDLVDEIKPATPRLSVLFKTYEVGPEKSIILKEDESVM